MHKPLSRRQLSKSLMGVLAAVAVSAGLAQAAWAADAAGIELNATGSDVVEPGKPLSARYTAVNHNNVEKTVQVRWSLQANPTFGEFDKPDPVLGYDHALGCKNTVSVDGKEMGSAKLCDGSDSSFGTPWGNGFKEAVATIELGQVRQVSAVRWVSGDANWVWKCDVSASEDGVNFQPVPEAQGVVIRSKWGVNSFPWNKPMAAKALRFRFHNDGTATNQIRLPANIMVYDGIANDPLSVPQVGQVVDSGATSVTIPANGQADLVISGKQAVLSGGYLVGLEQSVDGASFANWSNLFVRPADTVDTNRTRRIGINGGGLGVVGDEMRRCGFGWMRFENCKWMFYCDAPDHYFFDGSSNPGVNHDKHFSGFQKLGIKVLPYVFMTPDWATSAKPNDPGKHYAYPPKNDADYGEAIFQLVARYGSVKHDAAKLKTKDKLSGLKYIDAVELWNEPNFNNADWGAFLGSMPRFFELMRAGAEGARRADPSMIVTSCGLAGIDIEQVSEFSEYKYADGKTPIDVVDVMNVHFYSGREEPEVCGRDPNVVRDSDAAGSETYPEQMQDLVEWRDRVKPKGEIWLSETGNDVGGPIGLTERKQAAKLPRCIMIAMAAGIDKVMIYRETGSNPAMHEGAGMLRNDNSVRPVWFTIATMIRQLQGFEGKALRLPSDDPRVWMFLWEDGQRKVITAWQYAGTSKLGVDLGKATVVDAFGRTTQTPTADVVISEMPTYITVTGPSAAYDKLIADARAKAAAQVAERARLSATPAVLYDFGPAGQKVGMLKGMGAPRRYMPVSADMRWNDKADFGWVNPGKDDEQRWIPDPLERDSCRVNPENVFRFRLPPGKFTLKVSAEPWAQTGVITIKSPSGEQKMTITKQKHVGTLTVQGGQVMDLTVDGQYLLKCMSAVSEAPAAK